MAIDFRMMTKEQLDVAYNNTQAVNNFQELLKTFQELSAETFREHKTLKNIQYAEKKRNVIDIFPGGYHNSPTFLFIHGGYWQNCTKEDFAFIADGLVQENITVILAEYTLAPDATMAEIVNEIKQLLDFLDNNSGALPVNKEKFCLAGHSAGGHLTAELRDHSLVTHAMPLSALVDLEPIKLCWLNEKLQLTDKDVIEFSPIKHIRSGVPTHIHVGGNELPELLRHSRDYWHALQHVQNNVYFSEIAGKNHFTLLYEFGLNGNALKQSLIQLLKK